MKTDRQVEFGDFQTPLDLAREVCRLLVQQGVQPDAVIEPTCGVGAFLVAAAQAFPEARLFGWDINPDYVCEARTALARCGALERAAVGRCDFFTHDWDAEFSVGYRSLLILGNLPWVTNAAVSGMNGSNLPAKENFLGLRGIAARTGKSNFDISEWMLIRMVMALRPRRATIAMLCKTATARKLLRFAWQNDGRIARANLYLIDAKKHFGASVNAALLVATTGHNGPAEADLFPDLAAKRPITTLGLAGQDLVSDIKTYRRLRHLEGLFPYQWRSGPKHDCASVMELSVDSGGTFYNKLGEPVSIESDFVFPLLKCSDLANGRLEPRRFVLVPQKRIGDDTMFLAKHAPRTWSYLNAHRKFFEARKSAIYSKNVPYAIFGVGDYTFAPWKVAISGLHHMPRFALVGPKGGKPVVFDDTCYFLPFEDVGEAQAVAEILNTPECAEFLASLIFPDSKRPITVELLQRLNLKALAEDIGLSDAWAQARRHTRRYDGQAPTLQPELLMDQSAETKSKPDP